MPRQELSGPRFESEDVATGKLRGADRAALNAPVEGAGQRATPRLHTISSRLSPRLDDKFSVVAGRAERNGLPRTFRDQKAMAYEAARFAKAQNPDEILEIVDRSNGTKLVMLADGRTA